MSQATRDCPRYELERDGEHTYMSTGCYHGQHEYCQSNTGANGDKIPAQCKFCAAPCVCKCHKAQP